MALLASQNINRAGIAPAYAAAAAGGDTFVPGQSTFLHIKNGSAGAVTATLVTPGTVDDLAVADLAVSVPAAGERMVGPVTADLFRKRADGLADVTWSAAASVTVAVLSV